MSLIRTRLRRKTNDGADTIYIETLSSMVMRPSDHSIEEDLATVETTVASKVGTSGSGLNNNVLAAFDGNGNIKSSAYTTTDLSNLNTHAGDTSNPHSVTAAQVGAYTTNETDSAISNAIDQAVSDANAATGVIPETYGLTANATPSYGANFVVPKFVVNAAGKITNAGNYTITLPAVPSVNFTSGLTATSTGVGNSISINVTDIDATKLTGLVPLTSIPKAAISEMKVVSNNAAMYALTTNDVQTGDVVKVNDTDLMYFVKDDTKLGSATPEDAFEEFKTSILPVTWNDVTDKPSTFTPAAHNHTVSDITDFPTIPEASDFTPAAAGTANAGSSNDYARADHVHPLQTSVSGNAGTATQFSANKNVTLTGDVTGTASSKAGWSVATTLANSGVTADTYGPSANASPDEGDSITIPQLTVDSKGRVTGATDITITLPVHEDPVYLDANVLYNTTNANAKLNVSLAPNGVTNGDYGGALVASTKTLTYNPYTGNLEATKFNNHTIESNVPSGAVFTDTNTTYVVSTGDSNGQIKVTPSTGNAYDVDIKGLGSAAYTESTDYATANHTHPEQVNITGNAGTATKLAAPVDIGLSGVTATAQSFDGSGDITIPITDVPASIVSGLAAVATTGSYTSLSNKPTIPSATTTTPKANGTAAVGSETKWAKGDHVHPLQTTVSGNAGTATKLANSVNIGLSGVTATAQSFDGSGDITIPITEVPTSVITGLAAVATSGSYNDLTNKPTIASAATTEPAMDGTAAVGTSAKYAKEDHVHPTDTSRAASSHTHGNVTNAGAITATGVAIANGDAIAIVDASNSSKLAKTSITFDASTATKALTQKGTWETFNNYTHPTTTAVTAAAVKVGNDASGHVVLGSAITPADIGAATSDHTHDVMTKATSSAAGTAGLVPAPAAGNQSKFLRGDATWQTVVTSQTQLSKTDSGSGNAVTSITVSNHAITVTKGETFATKAEVDALGNAMIFKGTVGSSSATVTALPSDARQGDTYKVITAGTYGGQTCKIGDTLICGANQTWELIPSGDEPSGTVTSIKAGNGLAGGTITTSGTISHATTTAVDAAAVKIGKDGYGHVVIGAALTNTDVGAAATSHAHGNITSAGAITATAVAIANGDSFAIVDSSASGKVVKSSITFDGSTATKALTKKGTWETFNNYSHPTTTAVTAAAVKVGKDSSGHVVLGSALSYTDVGAAAESHSHFATDPTDGQVVVADGTAGGLKTTGYTIAKSVPSNAVFTDTNTKVTAVGNHYTPSGGTAAVHPATALTGVNFIDQISITKDAAGHVTAVSTTSHALTKANITGLGIPASDTHYTTHLYAGSGTAANAATTNGNTKITVVDNTTARDSVTIKGSGTTTVTSDANGAITVRGIDFVSSSTQPTGQVSGDYWFETIA